jgi:hypothetical protein
VHATIDALQGRLRWVIPLDGEIRAGDDVARAGDCLLLAPDERLSGTARMLIGASA